MEKRNYNIDFIKFIAIVFVIGIHITAQPLFDHTIASKKWDLILFYRCIVASAVPLFFMCSGALLFDKNKDISVRQIYTKYIKRIFIALIFWASVYEILNILTEYSINHVIEKSRLSLGLQNIIFFKHNYQLYFIYLMFLFYAFTPVVKTFINNADKKLVEYLLILWFVLGITLPTAMNFPFFGNFYNLNIHLVMKMSYSAIFYGILGYYITNNSEKFSKRFYILSYVAGFLMAFICTYMMCKNHNDIVMVFLGGMSISVMLMAMGVYGIVTKTDKKIYRTNFVKTASNSTFCIFLIHDVYIRLLRILDISVFSFPPIINVPIIIFIVFILSFISYILLRKIKIVRKYLI